MTAQNIADDPRRFVDIGTVELESGEQLPDVRVAYETWGTFTGDNAILIEHALTGDTHVAGQPGGWWDGVVGDGKAIDSQRWFVVATNVLGGCQGTTGPASVAPDGHPWGSRFPDITVRDQVTAEIAVADALGIDRWHAAIGGSAGGMRALEWAIMAPERVNRLLLFATSAAASAEQIAQSSLQQAAIDLDPDRGLDLARRIAHLSYRSEPEMTARFGRNRQADGRFAVASYLEHHGAKLVRRFDANSYLVLTRAMDSHDVGRDRGGISAALAQVTATTLVVGIDSDRLYPIAQQQLLAEEIASAGPLALIHSLHGHDGFLVESAQVGAITAPFLQPDA